LEHLAEDMKNVGNFTIKTNGKKNKFYGVYQIQILGNEVGSIEEIDKKKEIIDYT
jgi:hypothetical protein